jgi:hypothetical protein
MVEKLESESERGGLQRCNNYRQKERERERERPGREKNV